MLQYRAIVRYFHGYDYRSLYKTVPLQWRKEKKVAEADLRLAWRDNFYTAGFIEQGEANE